ncbi:Stanniocalcin [Dissostichus eleginoides]|uniref:Stanniocalcin n=1 Tax=Dissostichus eleginoides TaxID=100907 RepID=A0AAD9BJM0_DISEL|nr:Stanniocalcin [Dissostichus eleginoides]
MCSTPLALLLVLSTASCFELLPEEAAPRRARFSSNTPTDVARCLNGAVTVGCGFFSCLENSTCDTDGMHEICELFLQSASSFNTETFVKKSLHCITQGISTKIFQTIRRCNIFQRMIAEVQEDCFSSLDICTVARTNPDAIGEVVQILQHSPTDASVIFCRSLGFQQPSSWKNTPVFNIQPGFRGRDPTHLFARKRSVDDMEGGVNAEQ